MKERIEFIDTAKGICIILVVFFHVKEVLDCDYYLDDLFSSFRLPLYFFLSGLFFKDYGSFKSFLRKKTNNLLIPFLFFYITCSVLLPNLLHICFDRQFNTVLGWPSLWAFIYPCAFPNIPIWFLWCLFLMNILFWTIQYIVYRYSPHNEAILIAVSCLIIGIMGYHFMDADMTNYGNILTALLNIPFFCIGYLFKKFEFISRLQRLSGREVLFYSILLSSILFYLTIVLSYKSSLTYYISGITGTLVILLLSYYSGRIPYVSYLGRFSIIVLVTHGMIMWSTNRLYPFFADLTNSADIATFIMAVLTLSCYTFIIPFMCRYFPHVTAQKPVFL